MSYFLGFIWTFFHLCQFIVMPDDKNVTIANTEFYLSYSFF